MAVQNGRHGVQDKAEKYLYVNRHISINICVLGDSHTETFNKCNTKQATLVFDVCKVFGATAQGAVNPISVTDAFNIYVDKLSSSNILYNKVMIMLGEVDCSYLIWVRSKRYNISVDDQINNSVNNLFTFLKSVLIEQFRYLPSQIVILGAHLPTICDDVDKSLFKNERGEVDIPQIIRTEKTLEYNNILRKRCENEGYLYIDITSSIINDNGLIDTRYCNKDPVDNHPNFNLVADLWLEKIQEILCVSNFSITRGTPPPAQCSPQGPASPPR